MSPPKGIKSCLLTPGLTELCMWLRHSVLLLPPGTCMWCCLWRQVGFRACADSRAQPVPFLQVSITDYVVFDQCSLFQTIMHATHSVATAAQAPVEKVADKLRMAFWSQQLQCQPSLLGVNKSGVWISSGKNEFHVAKGSLIGESITLVLTLFLLCLSYFSWWWGSNLGTHRTFNEWL